MSGPVPIVLASRSPRRRQLLEEADWSVRIEVPDVDDGLLDCGDTPADEWVSALAVFKATATAIMLEELQCDGGLVERHRSLALHEIAAARGRPRAA